ncbi:SH3 domain-containing protein [Leptodesmis sichuanensis]|uniref:SH3 domain-containing protein n=1 Tax=Leptodesmis sichuanensis TaxID=2906798 RepID=UPI001F3DF7B7|nr:SH3 domain-containing protein [Leptodesmis sichuanensis]
MNISKSLFAVTLAIASLSLAVSVKADTVQARCDVYPKGEDRATSSGLCTFSQRQGVVGIQLKNGKRYDLVPVGNQPGNYRDQNGRAAYRQSGLGNKGQIYRLATESIYVYWDTAPYGKNSETQNSGSSTSPVVARGISTLKASSSNTRINVRSQPTIKSDSPHYGIPGDKVKVIQCVQDQDTAGSDLNWCRVEFVNSKATGWVRSDFIIFADGGE